MPDQPDAPRLVRGPHRAPQCRIGESLHDAIRGDIVVVSISQTPIPWPLGRQRPHAKLAPIVTKELERAIRTESALAMQFWWGVGNWLVSKWRRELGVPLMTEGTTALFRELAPLKFAADYRSRAGRLVGRPCELSRERAADLKRRALAGQSRSALAREYGVSRQWVAAIAQGVRKV